MIEEWCDRRIGSITRDMTTNFKGHIKKLPKNRNKNPKYLDKDFHELVKMNVKDTIHTTTVNNHIGYCSSFFEWSVNHGYAHNNTLKGLKLKKDTRPKDERQVPRDRFEKVFSKRELYSFHKIEERRYELYWTPLNGIFTGMKLGEITQLYLENIREIKGSHRNKRSCFDNVVEPE